MMLLLRVLLAVAVHIAAAQGCDLTFNQVFGTFTSPGFPHNAGDNLICRITIQAEAGDTVHIKCTDFHISSSRGCQEQYLKIGDVYFCKKGGIENMANEGGPMAMTFVTSARGGTKKFTCDFVVRSPTPVGPDPNACRLGGTLYDEHTTLGYPEYAFTVTCIASEWSSYSDPPVAQSCYTSMENRLSTVRFTGLETGLYNVQSPDGVGDCHSLLQSGNAIAPLFGIGIKFEGGEAILIINNEGHIVRHTAAELIALGSYHVFTNGAVWINYGRKMILFSNGLQVFIFSSFVMVITTPTMVSDRDLQGLCGHYDGAGDLTISSRDGSETQKMQTTVSLDTTILDSWKLDPLYCHVP